MQKETYHENQQNEIFKIKDVQNTSEKRAQRALFSEAYFGSSK